MIRTPERPPAFPLGPEDRKIAVEKALQEKTTKEAALKKETHAKLETMRKDVSGAEALLKDHGSLFQEMRRMNEVRLRTLAAQTEENRKDLVTHEGTWGRLSEDERSLLEPVLEALRAAPPSVPAWGDAVDNPSQEAGRYLSVWNEAEQSNASDDIRLFAVHINVAQILRDRDEIDLMLRLHEGNTPLVEALTLVRDRLTLFAQLDPARYAQYEHLQRESYTREAFGQMGKLLAVAGLSLYALVDTLVALANKRMPTMGLIAGLGAAVIADRRLRRSIFGRQELVRLEEVDSVLDAEGFQMLAERYEFYSHGDAWPRVIERLMDEREDVSAFLKQMGSSRADEVATKEAQSFVNGLTRDDDNAVREHLLTMIAKRDRPADPTHFESLVLLLSNVRSVDARELLVNILLFRATGRPRGTPPPAPTPAPTPPPGTVIV